MESDTEIDRTKVIAACCDAVDRLRDALDDVEGDRRLEDELALAINIVARVIDDFNSHVRVQG